MIVRDGAPTDIRAAAECLCGHLLSAAGCETGAVQPRRAVPLVLAVAGLLAVAALASHGRPLTGSSGTGPTPRFFDYVFTTIALFAIAIAVVFVMSIVGTKWDKPQGRPVFGLWQFVVSLVTALALGWLLLHAHFHFDAEAAQPQREAARSTARSVVPPARAASTRIAAAPTCAGTRSRSSARSSPPPASRRSRAERPSP